MKRIRTATFLVTFLFTSLSLSGEMKVKGEKTYKPYEKIVLKATDVSSAKAQFLWDVDGPEKNGVDYVEGVEVVTEGEGKDKKEVAVRGKILYVWAKPGKYRVRLTAIDFDSKKVERASFTFTVEGKAPDPPNPPPPTPGVPVITSFSPATGAAGTVVTVKGLDFGAVSSVTLGGKAATFEPIGDRYSELKFTVPEGATSGKISLTNATGTGTSLTDFVVAGPAPGPVPIPGTGLRVLIIYESADLTKLKKEQHPILFGSAFRKYLNENCVMGPDGKTKEWRIYDKDVDVSAESKTWQSAMDFAKKDPKFNVPWILISNGATGYSGPLPDSATAAEELVKKYVSIKSSMRKAG